MAEEAASMGLEDSSDVGATDRTLLTELPTRHLNVMSKNAYPYGTPKALGELGLKTRSEPPYVGSYE